MGHLTSGCKKLLLSMYQIAKCCRRLVNYAWTTRRMLFYFMLEIKDLKSWVSSASSRPLTLNFTYLWVSGAKLLQFYCFIFSRYFYRRSPRLIITSDLCVWRLFGVSASYSNAYTEAFFIPIHCLLNITHIINKIAHSQLMSELFQCIWIGKLFNVSSIWMLNSLFKLLHVGLLWVVTTTAA